MTYHNLHLFPKIQQPISKTAHLQCSKTPPGQYSSNLPRHLQKVLLPCLIVPLTSERNFIFFLPHSHLSLLKPRSVTEFHQFCLRHMSYHLSSLPRTLSQFLSYHRTPLWKVTAPNRLLHPAVCPLFNQSSIPYRY